MVISTFLVPSKPYSLVIESNTSRSTLLFPSFLARVSKSKYLSTFTGGKAIYLCKGSAKRRVEDERDTSGCRGTGAGSDQGAGKVDSQADGIEGTKEGNEGVVCGALFKWW